ncbi:MAG: hypothetical protein ACTSQS_19005, partial [Promethearchaeota archaeon]
MEKFNEINSMANGLNFYKTDLHIHCPITIRNESENYAEGIELNNIINKLIEHNFNLVCIGHHNSVESISKLSKYLQKNNKHTEHNLTVLPSIEINMRENFHLL